MISKVTQESLIWCCQAGSWLRCLPFGWDQNLKSLRLHKEEKGKGYYYFWLISELLGILYRLGALSYLFYIVRFGKNIRPQDVILAAFFMGVLLMAIQVHVLIFFMKGTEVKLLINSLLSTNRHLNSLSLQFSLKSSFLSLGSIPPTELLAQSTHI